MASGLNYKYFHNSGFDAVKINGGTNALLRKHVQGVHPETLGIATTLIGKLAADSRVTDIRYMTYMFATACHEARELKPDPVNISLSD